MIDFIKTRLELFYHLIILCQNWFAVLYNIYVKKEETIYKLRNGTKFYIRKPSDLEAITENWALKWSHSYLSYFTPKGKIKTIIDIGAHIGTFTLKIAKEYPQASLYCFEPDRTNFLFLKKNIALNFLENIKAFDIAISNKDGKIRLYSKQNRDFGSMGSSTVVPSEKSIMVSCKTLLSVFNENDIDICDILKLDCEGAEYDILMSQDKKCFDKINTILLEYHEYSSINGNSHMLVKHLEDFGFKVKCIAKKNSTGFIIAEKIKI